MGTSRRSVVRTLGTLSGLAALTCYQPVITGYLWYYNFGDPLLMALRKSLIAFLVIVYLSARLGGRWGFITAPAVVVTSGIWYAYVEAAMKGDRDFGENVTAAICAAIVLALPLGWVVSHYRSRIDGWLASRNRSDRADGE